jgi:hypothetical protein
MLGCACKRGFLVLRDCGKAAVATCAECSRGVCAEHMASESALCVDCAAKRAEAVPPRASDPADLGTRVAARQRHAYYTERDYHPFISGYPTPYYDTYDTRAFDDSETAQGWSGDAGPSFLDS